MTGTILCFGDSNTHGSMMKESAAPSDRFAESDRWPGVLRHLVAPGWTVVEEGLPGRTTVHDDPIEGRHKNGLRYLPACLESHRPIEILAVMLGTNDLKARFSLPPGDIAAGVAVLCETALASGAGPGFTPPRLLVIAPVPIIETGLLAEMFGGGAAKSRQLAELYRGVATAYGAAFLDAGSVATCSPVDGIHFDPDQHRRLGAAVAETIRTM